MRNMRMPGTCAAVFASVMIAAASWPAAGVQAAVASAGQRSAAHSALGPPGASAVPIPAGLPGLQAVLRGNPAAARAVPGSGILEGVYCTSRKNCWAVGERFTAKAALNQVLRWKGTSWNEVAAPNPGGSSAGGLSGLAGVRCLTAGNCWAVGEYAKHGALLSETLHWNGKKWSHVATPATGGHHTGDVTELIDVTCTAAASCWAVGDFGKFTGSVMNPSPVKMQNLVLHWNGSKWSRVSTPEPAGTSSGRTNSLFGVRCVSRANCTAVGDYGTIGSSAVLRNEALHWNGSKWSKVHTPNPGGSAATHVSELAAIGCGSSASCFAVGQYGTESTSHDQILRWNGKHWTKAGAPDPAGGQLIGVMCVTAHYCWAVGNVGSGSLTVRNQAVHWNGKKWSVIHTPNPGSGLDVLIAVRCTSATNCWAVGLQEAGGTVQDEILHWDGAKWSVA